MSEEKQRELHHSIVVGKYGEQQFRQGWHERENDGRFQIPYRSSKGEGWIKLARTRGAKSINVLVSGPCGLAENQEIKGTIEFDGDVHSFQLNTDCWAHRSFPMGEKKDDILRVKLFVPRPVVPDVLLKNGDARSLGWFLSAIWQE